MRLLVSAQQGRRMIEEEEEFRQVLLICTGLKGRHIVDASDTTAANDWWVTLPDQWVNDNKQGLYVDVEVDGYRLTAEVPE